MKYQVRRLSGDRYRVPGSDPRWTDATDWPRAKELLAWYRKHYPHYTYCLFFQSGGSQSFTRIKQEQEEIFGG